MNLAKAYTPSLGRRASSGCLLVCYIPLARFFLRREDTNRGRDTPSALSALPVWAEQTASRLWGLTVPNRCTTVALQQHSHKTWANRSRRRKGPSESDDALRARSEGSGATASGAGATGAHGVATDGAPIGEGSAAAAAGAAAGHEVGVAGAAAARPSRATDRRRPEAAMTAGAEVEAGTTAGAEDRATTAAEATAARRRREDSNRALTTFAATS